MTIHVLRPGRRSRVGLRPRPLTFAELMDRDAQWRDALQLELASTTADELRRRAQTARSSALFVAESLRSENDDEAKLLQLRVAGRYAHKAECYEAAAEAKS